MKAISVENLNYSYKNGFEALKNINLDISTGEFVAIVGENGSGKTTLVKHFNGLLLPSEGKVKVFGEDTRKSDRTYLTSNVGLIFQNPDTMLFADTVEKEVLFGLRNIDIEETKNRVDESLKSVGLEKYKDKFPRYLSRGERQRLAFACIMAMKPRVIILDEPTTGLDIKESRKLLGIAENLRSKGHTIIIVTHSMELVAEYSKRTIVMENGNIIYDGPTNELLSRRDLTSVKKPTITELSHLYPESLRPDIFSVEDMVSELVSIYKKSGGI
jgi:energy-coupling factor transport system ATP-binding protein